MSSTAMQTFVTSVFDRLEIPTGSKRSFRSVLLWLEGALSKAFTIPSIKEALSTTSYRPFNEAQIMSGWFNWSNIAAEQAECLLACIPECKEIAAELGRVPDSAIHDILEKMMLTHLLFLSVGRMLSPSRKVRSASSAVCGSTVKVSLQVSSEKERQLPRKKNQIKAEEKAAN